MIFDVNAKHDLDLDFEIDQLASEQVAYDCAPNTFLLLVVLVTQSMHKP